MAGLTSDSSDNEASLWKKIAWNLYNAALFVGVTGLNPPSWNDNIQDLQKKSAYYTAALV